MVEADNTKKEIESENHRKPLFDKGIIFHFLFGCGLGIILSILIDFLVLSLILGIILIPLIEYVVHKIFEGYATLKTKHALLDLIFTSVGLVFTLLTLQFFIL